MAGMSHASTPSSPPPDWFTLPHAPTVGTVLGHTHSLPDQQVTLREVDTGAGIAHPFRLLLLRDGGRITAFVNRCPHFGVPLAVKQAHLIFTAKKSITCNVHYARFRWEDGACESGECLAEGLIPVPIAILEDGQICIAP